MRPETERGLKILPQTTDEIYGIAQIGWKERKSFKAREIKLSISGITH